ncbi:hypothetical protein [Pseudoclavibacter sp. JSM 162008]|uniref:DUF7687 domain-containing protein n=1 Tax=Pseudoclavibacter sp. JSM 162008 TaxID=3229855 RepID=UPI00352646F4
MQADPRFRGQGISFWAYVRTITEALGSSVPRSGVISAFSIGDMQRALTKLERAIEPLGTPAHPSPLGAVLLDYFEYRADVLNNKVRHDLLVTEQAAELFDRVVNVTGAVVDSTSSRRLKTEAGYVEEPTSVNYRVGNSIVPVPMNKQKGLMRQPSFLTGIVNLVIARELEGRPCDYDPRRLPVIDHDGTLYAAMSRRMDGSMPSTVNPLAMWEIKEYYYTTTFGSKISDAVYITALDGYERAEIEQTTQNNIEHLIIVDAFDTWWTKGKSYLCRMVDLVNMGKVDHLICGRETVEELPRLAQGWAARYDQLSY